MRNATIINQSVCQRCIIRLFFTRQGSTRSEVFSANNTHIFGSWNLTDVFQVIEHTKDYTCMCVCVFLIYANSISLNQIWACWLDDRVSKQKQTQIIRKGIRRWEKCEFFHYHLHNRIPPQHQFQ